MLYMLCYKYIAFIYLFENNSRRTRRPLTLSSEDTEKTAAIDLCCAHHYDFKFKSIKRDVARTFCQRTEYVT
jgi:hypothetical protein